MKKLHPGHPQNDFYQRRRPTSSAKKKNYRGNDEQLTSSLPSIAIRAHLKCSRPAMFVRRKEQLESEAKNRRPYPHHSRRTDEIESKEQQPMITNGCNLLGETLTSFKAMRFGVFLAIIDRMRSHDKGSLKRFKLYLKNSDVNNTLSETMTDIIINNNSGS